MISACLMHPSWVNAFPCAAETFRKSFAAKVRSMASRTSVLPLPAEGQDSRSTLSVLIVDDDELMTEFLSLTLEQQRGCSTTCVGSGEAAMAALGTSNFDLLITDWQMPGMDGMELVRRARLQRNPESHLHIAMMTARDDAEVIRRALKAGVDDFLLKPIDPVQLELAIASARRNHHLHRRLRRRAMLLAAAHRRASEALARVQVDLDAAAVLHERLLPQAGTMNGLRLDRLYRPAASLGGDTMGAVPLPPGGVLFFLLDVCGHGVPTALESFHLHHRLAGLRPNDPERLAAAAATLNREIAEREDGSYATMVAGIAWPERGEGWLVRAGHPPPLLAAQGTCKALDEGGGLPLGWVADAQYAPVRFPLERGARLAVYSDGLSECADTAGVMFGPERLAELVASLGRTPSEVIVAVERTLAARAVGGFADDVSLLLLECV